jgi:DNA invertase Pin-like site-specific DNA recombinase
MENSANAVPVLRAAEYLRMSTDRQYFSIPHQKATIREYADLHGMTVVRSYSDEAKSGLTLEHREALVELLRIVQSGSADFDVILVYDVSRWGRFQDIDESAYYEYLCRRSNVRVEYCAEPFVGQTGPLANILKSIKRTMAAEFSREYATRIAGAKRRAAMLGFFTGGPPGYALRRMVIGKDGKHLHSLEPGAHKSIRNYRTILMPGPRHEVNTVKRIYHLYVDKHLDSGVIANLLNEEGNERAEGKRWTDNMVLRVLRNERYMGKMIVWRTSSNLAAGRVEKGHIKTDPSMWTSTPLRFKAFISPEMFERARKIREVYGRNYHDEEEMLEGLRKLLRKHGHLNMVLIAAAKGIPSVPAYERHFGGLRQAYARIGYVPPRDWKGTPTALHRAELVKAILARIASEVRNAGGSTSWDGPKQQITVNGSRTIAVVVAHHLKRKDGPKWEVMSSRRYLPDAMIVVRLDCLNKHPLDYLSVPRVVAPAFLNKKLRDEPTLQFYRCPTEASAIFRSLSDFSWHTGGHS